MNLNIWLPEQLANELTEAAHAAGCTGQDVVRAAVERHLHPSPWQADEAAPFPDGVIAPSAPFEVSGLRIELPEGADALAVLGRGRS